MEVKFKFEKLNIWNRAMNIADDLQLISLKFPKHEKYSLTSQLNRSSDSIALNIAEGSIGQSNPEQKKFMGYSIRSLAEVVTCLHKAKRRDYITENTFKEYYQQSFDLMNMMIAFRNKIN